MSYSDDESEKDPIPSWVGEGDMRFDVHEDRHLGSGHFGDVYLGTQQGTGLQVAVKLEHRSSSVARREWELLRYMNGDGAPKLYWSGSVGIYYVSVMSRLGPTMQKLMEWQPNRRLPWHVVRDIGFRCVELLRKLHSKGYVHGDVKPENFLCAYPESGSADVRQGLYLIDFGLASRWRDLTRASGHIAYGQRMDHFSGTVRYASVNAHLGRWLSRRDDLESLGYTMLYLLIGSLPWQGYTSDNKNMAVCEHKGRLTMDSLCNGAPIMMQYFLAYVRSLKFEETPDYDYLLRLCELNGLQQINHLLRSETDPHLPALHGRGIKREHGTEQEANSSGDTNKRRRKVVVPKTEKLHQWIVVSTSARNSVYPGKQCYTSHTGYENLLREVENKWEEGLRIECLCFAGDMWTAILNQKNTGFVEQTIHYEDSSEFPRSWVREKWSEGMYITAVAGNRESWGVVMSKMDKSCKYKQQSYIVSTTFPTKWVSQKWECDYHITSIATQGSLSQQWVVIMSRGSRFTDQVVELDFCYPSQSIHARWDSSYLVTGCAGTRDIQAFVMSRGEYRFEEQRCTRTSHPPLSKIREDWNDGLFVKALSYGRVS